MSLVATDQAGPVPDRSSVEKVHAVIRVFFSRLTSPSTPYPVVLAVSGGPDSLCMADAIIDLQSELHLSPVIAHLNHGLRGKAAVDDADFVRSFADARGIEFYVLESDVQGLSMERHLSIEEAARIARYTFLASVAEATHATHIALAHNADDQVETVLLRLIRGTGLTGLQGIQAISPLKTEFDTGGQTVMLLRPLLSLPRSVIEAYCSYCNLSPRHDSTNDERHHLRNRIRLDLLPLLEQYNPGIRKVIGRLAETATAEMEIVMYATQQALGQLRIHNEQEVTIDRSAWSALPISLQRATLREAILQFNGELTHVKYAGIEEARDVLNSTAVHAEIAVLANIRIVVTPQRFWFTHTKTDLL
jgi:tRNA(Ile)-lysidine synthetase-like protein